jgi:hypothetical protein
MTAGDRPRRRGAADAVLVAALAGGATQADAAAEAGVSERTVRRRLDAPAFRQDLDVARADLVRTSTDRLVAGVGAAIDTLEELMATAPAYVRVRAATAMLDAAHKWRSTMDLEERIGRLEALLNDRKDD